MIGAGDLDALLLAVAERAERAVGEVVELPLREHAQRPALVDVFVRLVPATEHRVRGGQHDVEHRLVRRHALGHRRGGEADARTQLEDVGAAEPLPEDRDGARTSGAAACRRAAAVSSCPRRWARGSPSARRRSTDQSRWSTMSRAFLRTTTSENSSTCGMPSAYRPIGGDLRVQRRRLRRRSPPS